MALFLTVLAGLLPSACGGTATPSPAAVPRPVERRPASTPDEPLAAAVRATLLKAAREYESYSRVDDETHWAPFLCRSPVPGQARWSAPPDSPHGQKLYSVFARFRNEYVQEGPPAQSVGQILVKESWIPKEVPLEEGEKAMAKARLGCFGVPSWNPYAKREGRIYRASEKAGLFIMAKTGGREGETDAGWVYATVSADGREVTSAGRLPACMSCHQKAPGDRLFGTLPVPW